MTSRTNISAYTPSNTDPEVLERIFVQREKLLKTIVRRLAKSMSSGDKHHILLSGPRGSGKTCFLTLVHHRLTQHAALKDSMRIAWLGEDAVITSLVDLALEMADQLVAEYPDEFDADIRTSVRGLAPDDAAESILKDLVKRLEDRHLLLMMENLDRAFQGLGDSGQKKWRAFLQETKKVATLATTQQMFDGVSKRDEAFFGFFDIHHLEPLSCDDAARLIAKVAKENGNDELVKFLNTSKGRFRVRALRHLAGGNHRMYILLSEFLTKESLDELVDAFEHLAEELTPYFQERLRSLPPQQARVVQTLCNAEGALSVKAVAEDSFLPERNCSKHLGELKKKRYVISERRGKESYYEMAEPLMRLCLEIKNQRGRPLRLIALFLRAWFSLETLKAHKGMNGLSNMRSNEYCSYAMELEPNFSEYIQQELTDEIESQIERGQYPSALGVAEELCCADQTAGLYEKAYIHYLARNLNECVTCLSELLGRYDISNAQRGQALYSRAVAQYELGDIIASQDDYSSVIEMGGSNELWAKSLNNRSGIYWGQGLFQESLDDLFLLTESSGIPVPIAHKALFFIPESIVPVGSWGVAMDALVTAFEKVHPASDGYGGFPRSILTTVLLKGHTEWPSCVADLVRIYTKYGVCDKLCSGLTQAIEYLDTGDYSDTQLDAWNDAWQKAGKDMDECQIALRSLDCAVRAIKSKSDRPLFELPLEIRELIIPLLPTTCSQKK